ncbi:hypothetical protein PM082_018318 [Marasmius tenuissimus]|nr:hypothetical protein PM082_018318 [Marasmius tenuissimus]
MQATSSFATFLATSLRHCAHPSGITGERKGEIPSDLHSLSDKFQQSTQPNTTIRRLYVSASQEVELREIYAANKGLMRLVYDTEDPTQQEQA